MPHEIEELFSTLDAQEEVTAELQKEESELLNYIHMYGGSPREYYEQHNRQCSWEHAVQGVIL